MDRGLIDAMTAGSERVAAWADLLDEINVFPVADGDTGRNLKISLAPLGRIDGAAVPDCCRQLVEAATGNSGNIAAAFLTAFLATADRRPLDRAVAAGREAAWAAVADPRPGTMLSVYDALATAAAPWPTEPGREVYDRIVERLDRAVRSGPQRLPSLEAAGVVDAGALGMFIFFEGFFHRLLDGVPAPMPIDRRFAGLLQVTGPLPDDADGGYCVHTILTPSRDGAVGALAAGLGDSVVAVPDGGRVRLHLHTADRTETRRRLEELGRVDGWRSDPLTRAPAVKAATAVDPPAVHIVTDAAGSVTRDDARELGITLLDSYLVVEGRRIPETLADREQIYRIMAAGGRVSTAQASTYQQQQSYESVLGRFPQVLYLAVGAAYTGNVATARRWTHTSGAGDRFRVLDTGAASGRLGLIVRAVADYARSGAGMDDVQAFADQAIARCGELLFLDQLKFLAAGGRISRSRGFFGDLLGIKPVISPRADGAVKIGTVRREAQQTDFALDHLKRCVTGAAPHLLLQFSDNEARVRESIAPRLARQFPGARIAVGPLSLTAGAHMGPGTWGLAYCETGPPAAATADDGWP